MKWIALPGNGPELRNARDEDKGGASGGEE